MGLVRACMRSLPRIAAAEHLMAATQVAVGTGHMTRENLDEVRGNWQKAAAPRAARTRAPRLPDAEMGAHGIKVVRVRRAVASG